VPIEPWVTLQDVAKHLQVAEDTVHRWLKRGMPATKAGRVWRFKLSEVDAWVREGVPESSPADDAGSDSTTPPPSRRTRP